MEDCGNGGLRSQSGNGGRILEDFAKKGLG
jgi:hypothetical protein